MIEVLECTLRDGSYPISYQFTAEDTAVIAAGLEDAGFRWIEVGHGLGMGASGHAHGPAAAADEDYLDAATGAVREARIGMFFIPGIADEHHLRLAKRCGADFIRVGTDVTQTDRAQRYIRLAKDLGITVSANLMKTYAVDVDEVVRRSEALAAWGADVVCVVDSAGGMLPDEVQHCVSRVKDAVGVTVGYHGHNNLQLAIANTLTAIEAGAGIVDTTLRGMGRSSGNAQTEVLLLILKRRGIKTGIDAFRAMDLGEKLIDPLVNGRGSNTIEATLGYAQFHSSFLKTVLTVAREMSVDPRQLIIRLSEIDKINVTRERAEYVAEALRAEAVHDRPPNRSRIAMPSRPSASEGVRIRDRAVGIAREMYTLSAKTGRPTVFTIAGCPGGEGEVTSFPFIRVAGSYVIGNAEVASVADGIEIAAAVDGLVDAILVDQSRRGSPFAMLPAMVKEAVSRSRVLVYDELTAMVQAADALLTASLNLSEATIGICHTGAPAWRLALVLAGHGARVLLYDPTGDADHIAPALADLLGDSSAVIGTTSTSQLAGSQVIVGAEPRTVVVPADAVRVMAGDGLILDMGIGTLAPGAIAAAEERGIRMFRLDMRAALLAQVTNSLETERLLARVAGRYTLSGVTVVAGGIIGQRGDVVIDAAIDPTSVIGVADGRGNLLHDGDTTPYSDRMETVRQALLEARLS